MKTFNRIWLILIATSILTSCETEIEEDPVATQELIGLWRGSINEDKRMVQVYNLKDNNEAVGSSYYTALMKSSLKTEILSPWKATTDMVYFDEKATLYNREGKLFGVDGTDLEEFPLDRIYYPKTQKGVRGIPDLIGKTWTGYYNDRVITLEFKEDHTVIRTDKPNAGWEGSTQVKEYTWKIEDNVIKFENEDPVSPWGVGLEKDKPAGDLIYVDFGDACCAFGYFRYPI